MARSSIEERLAKLEEQKRQLEEQARSLRSRMSEDRRKLETRQRILLGAFLHPQLGRNDPSVQAVRAFVARELPGFLTKPRDRDAMSEVLDALGKGQPVPASALEDDAGGNGDVVVASDRHADADDRSGGGLAENGEGDRDGRGGEGHGG